MAYTVKIRTKNHSASPLKNSINSSCRTVVRLGSRTPIERIFPKGVQLGRRIIEINTPEAVENSSNKIKMKECFTDKSIPQTEWSTKDKLFEDSKLTLELPIIAKRIYGFKGRGMQKLDTEDKVNDFVREHSSNYIYENFKNYAREYRLHCTQTECFLAWRKLRRSETPEDKRWFFNSDNCNWVNKDHELFNKPSNWRNIVDNSIKAVTAVGLDIGAVDVRVQANRDSKYIILEVNSAPSLGEIGVQKYKEQILKLISRNA